MRVIIILERSNIIKTYRIFSCIIYDNIDFYINEAIKHNLTYFYIKHIKEEEEKKDHYHFVIYTSSPTTISKISRVLDLQENYINVTDSKNNRYTLKNTIGYLLHYNMEDKKLHYNKEDIISNNNFIVNKYYNILTNNNDEERNFLEILSFIEDNNIKSLKELCYFAFSINSLSVVKKYQYIFNNIIKENLKY